VSVSLVINHDISMRLIILSSVACPAVPYFTTVKKKVKVALRGLSTPRPLVSIVFLPQQVPAFISRGATQHTDARDLYQRRRELLTILLADPEFTKSDGIFYMPQSWDMGYIVLLPLRRKAYWGFLRMPEKSNGFGRVWTRVPVASMLTTRPPKPSS
jgi:hypothetical protein